MIPSDTQRRATRGVLTLYFILVFIATFSVLTAFWHFAEAEGAGLKLFVLAATLAYAGLYTAVPVAITALSSRVARRFNGGRPASAKTLYASAYAGAAIVMLALYSDYRLYELYEFHFNGFVWNLLTTPGGIAALGATDSTMLTIAFQVAAILAATALPLWVITRFRPAGLSAPRRIALVTAGVFLIMLAGVEGVFAYSAFKGKEEYLRVSEVIPVRLQTSMTTIFKRLGLEHTAMARLRIASGTVDYPGKHLEARPLASYPNVIMLVAESFRWDLLDPEITPNLWRFSNSALRFENHYSGGNRTRMGLFSMFYGLYSPYWYSFEGQRVAPALMNFVRERNYQLALHTSQSFSYPELRNTLFTGIPEEVMQELQDGPAWQRDIRNVSDIIGKLDRRDRNRPFFGFMFFESTHAPYTFPEEDVVRADYERDLNYIKMDLGNNVKRIHARYVNAAHHIDREVGRLLDYLRASGMLDNTIVLFTGDHGEEFMEKGHWGHGHHKSFAEEQLRVPLVLWLPGAKPEAVKHRTSHLQISPTLLERLGVTQDPLTYSSARTLFAEEPYFVAGDYNYMTVFDERSKVTFPFNGSDFFRYVVTDDNDQPVSREEKKEILNRNEARIAAVARESQRFVR